MPSYKNIIKAICGGLFKTLLPSLKSLNNIRIVLMYHRVVRDLPEGLYDPGMYVTVKSFEKHLYEIKKYFDIVPLHEMLSQMKDRGRLCALTFDDGWLDNYEVAFPVLKNYNMPATIFIPVDYIGTNRKFWFLSFWEIAQLAARDGYLKDFVDYLVSFVPSSRAPRIGAEGLKELTSQLKSINAYELEKIINKARDKFSMNSTRQRSIMNWEEIYEMGQHDISFGSHGLNHYILPTLNYELKKKEIVESFEKLHEKGVNIAPFFSYPNGDWDEDSASLVSSTGYKGALTLRLGLNTSNSDPYFLNRIAIHEHISYLPQLFWFRIFQAFLAGNKNLRS